MRYAVAHGRRVRPRGGPAGLGAHAVEALRAAGHEVVEVVAGSLVQARAACAALVDDGVDVLVVTGGDGVVSLATDLCAGTPTVVGILPAGTGNDCARSLGIPLPRPALLRPGRPARHGTDTGIRDDAAIRHGAVDLLLADHRRTVDTLHVTELDRHVLSSVPAALDARISDRANHWPRGLGPAAYSLSALVEIALLHRQPPLRYRLTVDGRTEELEALVVVPANLPFFGGGLRIAPDADPADGLLDLVIIRPVTPTEALGVLRAVRAGRHTSHRSVRITRAREVRIEGPDDIVAQGDGEALGRLPLTVQVRPSSLQVVAPPLT